MYKKHEIGKIGEDLVVKYLVENKYKIIERNFLCRQGEIDIIAKDREEYVFIEVKTRTNNLYGSPIEAVDTIKKKHIYKSAQYYIYKNRIENEFIRIDIVQVYLKGKRAHINHLKDAIQDSV